MRSINKVFLIGNLTRDPELRQTPNGQFVCTFGIATNRLWQTSNGTKQTSVEFHELVAWARLAENCHKHLKKGKLIYVEGYLKTRSWDTPEGVKKFKTEIIVQDMIMLDKREKNDQEENKPEQITQPEPEPKPEPVSVSSETNAQESQETQTPPPAREEKKAKKDNNAKHKKTDGPVEIDTDLGL